MDGATDETQLLKALRRLPCRGTVRRVDSVTGHGEYRYIELPAEWQAVREALADACGRVYARHATFARAGEALLKQLPKGVTAATPPGFHVEHNPAGLHISLPPDTKSTPVTLPPGAGAGAASGAGPASGATFTAGDTVNFSVRDVKVLPVKLGQPSLLRQELYPASTVAVAVQLDYNDDGTPPPPTSRGLHITVAYYGVTSTGGGRGSRKGRRGGKRK